MNNKLKSHPWGPQTYSTKHISFSIAHDSLYGRRINSKLYEIRGRKQMPTLNTLNNLLNEAIVQFTYKEETWILIYGKISLEKFYDCWRIVPK